MDKQLIINISFKLIIENGLEGFSIAKLANELNCTKSSVYNYFESKDQLLNEILINKVQKLSESINDKEEPEVLLRKYAHSCVDNMEIFTFLHKYSRASFISGKTMEEMRVEFKKTSMIVNKFIEKYSFDGEVSNIVIEALIFGPIHGLIMCSRGTNQKITSDDVDKLIDLILETIWKEANERNN